MIKIYIGRHVKHPFSSPILMKLEFSRDFFFLQNAQILNFMKIRPVRAELPHADRQT